MRGHLSDQNRLRFRRCVAHFVNEASAQLQRAQKAIGPAALEGELADELSPALVHGTEQELVRDEDFFQHDFVEFALAGHVLDRVDADARGT